MKETWSEVSSIMMGEIVSSIEKEEGWTKNIIIEVQDPLAIYSGLMERRLYLFNRTPDIGRLWKYGEQTYLDLLKQRAQEFKAPFSVEDMLSQNNIFYFCILDGYWKTGKCPTLIPIFGHSITVGENSKGYYSMSAAFMSARFLFLNFGDPLNREKEMEADNAKYESEYSNSKWYVKEGGKNIVDIKFKSYKDYPSEKRMYRIRAIKPEVWEKRLYDYLDNKVETLEGCMDDMLVKTIKIKGGPDFL